MAKGQDVPPNGALQPLKDRTCPRTYAEPPHVRETPVSAVAFAGEALANRANAGRPVRRRADRKAEI